MKFEAHLPVQIALLESKPPWKTGRLRSGVTAYKLTPMDCNCSGAFIAPSRSRLCCERVPQQSRDREGAHSRMTGIVTMDFSALK